MKSGIKTFLIITLMALGLIFLSSKSALASNENGSWISSVEAASSDTPSDSSTKDLDIDARKQILISVLESSQTEISDLKDSLSSIDTNDDDWNKIKNSLLDTLSGFQDYYQKDEDKINDTDSPITLDEIKTLAKDLKDWRENTYSPELDKITNMILIFKTDDFLNITQSRFDKISSDVKKLDKQKLIKTDSLKSYLKQADSHLKNIKTLNDTAKKLFLKSMLPAPTDESSTSTQSLNDASKNSASDNQTAQTQEDVQGTIRKIVKDSLKELKTTYEIFFLMNDKIKSGQ